MKYDNLLKTLFYETMPGLLRAMGCAPVEEYMTVEFPSRPKMVADVVARLADGKILHIEFQLSNDPRMHWRCYHYYGAMQEQWEGSEIVQVVVYLGNGLMTMATRIQRPKCDYSFEVLDMRDIPAEVFLDSANDAERVLALLCQSADPRETIRRVLASWKHLSDNALLENLEHLRTLSRLRRTEIIAKEEIERMPFDLEVTDSVFFTIGEARLLTRMLERRLGPLPEAILQRISQASTEQIELWADRAFESLDLAEIFAE